MLYEYSPKRLTLITIKNAYVYDTYPPMSRLQLLLKRSRIADDITGDISAVLIADSDVTPHETLMCSISNGLYPSSDPYHKGLFYDYLGNPGASPGQDWLYFAHVDVTKVLQNEGYIQMSDLLSRKRKGRRIPNNDVYNDDVHSILKRHGYVDSRT